MKKIKNRRDPTFAIDGKVLKIVSITTFKILARFISLKTLITRRVLIKVAFCDKLDPVIKSVSDPIIVQTTIIMSKVFQLSQKYRLRSALNFMMASIVKRTVKHSLK